MSRAKSTKSRKTTKRKTTSRNAKSNSLKTNKISSLLEPKTALVLLMIVVGVAAFFIYRANANEFNAVAFGAVDENCESAGDGSVVFEDSTSKRNANVCPVAAGSTFTAELYNHTGQDDYQGIITEMEAKGFNRVRTCLYARSTSGSSVVELLGLGAANGSAKSFTVSSADYDDYCVTRAIQTSNRTASVEVLEGSVNVSTITVSGQFLAPPPSDDGRTIIDMSAAGPTHSGSSIQCTDTGGRDCYYLDQPNTIYDFKNVSANRDVRIAADNSEVRNLRGPGARRIGQNRRLTTKIQTNSGFRDFDFTYVQTNHRGYDLVEPYLIGGTDVNPDPLYRDTNTHFNFVAYEGGDLIRPLLEDITIRSAQVTPGSTGSHHIECLIISNVAYGFVEDLTIRNLNCRNGFITGILMRFMRGTVTIENSTITRGPDGSGNAIQAGVDPSSSASIIWRNNNINGLGADFSGGWNVHPSSGSTAALSFRN